MFTNRLAMPAGRHAGRAIFALLLALPAHLRAQGAAAATVPPAAPAALRDVPAAAGVLAFVDVNVVPMDRERVLAHQTVLVRDGRIVAIGPRVPVPAGARRVEGAGRYLAPGLVDMHAHFERGTEDLHDAAGRQLAMYLAYGFTTVRGLGGAPTALALRDRVRAGQVLGPDLVVASPSVNGRSAHTPAEAVQRVEAAKRAGYDLIKTHGMFDGRATYDSMAAAAARVGLPLVGHVTPEYGLAHAMAAHQQVEHLDGYIAAVVADGTTMPEETQVIVDPAVLARVEPAKLRALARETARLGIWNGPTLALFETIVSDAPPESLAAGAAMRYVPKSVLATYAAQKTEASAGMPADGRRRFVALRREMVRALHDAGAKLLVGSDSPQFFMIPGDAALLEAEAFVAAGLTPYAALEAATRNPAEYLGRLGEQGTVAVGKRADLVLLDANPLADVRNLRRLSGVAVGGRWLDAARLAALREEVAASAAEAR